MFHAGEINYASTELLTGSENELLKKRRLQFLSALKRQNIDKKTLLASLDSWQSSRLLVIGDTILDQYILEGCWPTVIAPIELSYATENEVETFEITWRYDTFRVSGINL